MEGPMVTHARRRPKYKPRRRIGPLPGFVFVALRWAVAWAIVGLVAGVLSLVRKTLFFTEASAGPDGGTAFWLPVMIGASAAAGLGIGSIYTGLLAVSADWRDSLEGDDWKTRLGPYVLCGAAAGLIAGFLVGGFTGALFFAVLGACTAGALTWIDLRKQLDGAAHNQSPATSRKSS
jgi:MFS family permease